MKKIFILQFDTLRAAFNHLYFVAKLVSRMTINRDCLIQFEQFTPGVLSALSSLRRGYSNSLTFGFRLFGFDFAQSRFYLSKDIRRYGDIVVKLVVTYKYGHYHIEFED